MNRLQDKYRAQVVPSLQKQFQFKSSMQVPRIEKVVINVCDGEATTNPKLINAVVEEIATITGQKPVVTRAKKAISNFKLRQGQAIGASVTLRTLS